MIGPGWAELSAAMGPPPVVVGRVLGQDRPQMPLAEDQHLVCELGPGGEHEPFRITVRPRAARRDLHHLDTRPGQDGVERRGELPGPVPGDPTNLLSSSRIFSTHRDVALTV